MRNRAVFFSAFMSVVAAFAAETVTVDNVVSLTNELDRLNRLSSSAKKSQGTIILKKGAYDVSGCHMLCDPSDGSYQMSTSHLAVAYVTLKGETDNPRDTVIYGDRTEGILYMFMGNVHNLTISNGCRTVGSAGGGGVCARNEGSSLSNVVVTCCEAKGNGGGVYYANLYDCTLENCHSEGNGGGIYYSHKVIGGIIRNNTSTNGGGGACNACLSDVQIIGNSTAGNGGGVKWDLKDGTVNCVIAGNTAKIGGGVASAALVSDCVISNNVAVEGGGIADSTVRRCKIVHNTARALSSSDKVRGGGCYGSESGKCIAHDSLVAGNACAMELATTDRSGGAGEQTRFYGCTIRDNFARIGAALNWGLAEDCVISNNVSPLYYQNLRGVTSLKRCKISKASLTSCGSLTDCEVWGYDGKWELPAGVNVYTNGWFVNENTSSDTYRLFANTLKMSAFALTNCLIHGNIAYSVLFRDKIGEPVTVVNCTIADNTNVCMFAGFRIDTDPTPLYLKNTIICRNSQLSNPGNDLNFRPQYDSASECNVYLENCMIGPGGKEGQLFQSCTGLISSNDPRFQFERDPEHPYSLRRSSGAIGKGSVEDWMVGAYDIRNTEDDGRYLRLREGKVDLGCYQCWLDPVGMVFSVR